jgi:MFS family permease
MVGMGLVMMGPITYLPMFGQSVMGLGAITAGFVLTGMSLGWPLASAFSGRLYLRIGFRDTALIGVVLIVVGALGFLPLSRASSLWLLVLDQVVLGAGFGLLSTPLLVGVQSTVTWHDRGVVTGANIFSRYLGQSLGAAIFGAIFNNAFGSRLADAPLGLRAGLPRDIDAVVGALHGRQLPPAVADYLRESLYVATHHVYAGVSVVAVLTLMAVALTPRRFAAIRKEWAVPAAD